jgi:hypothetical protein
MGILPLILLNNPQHLIMDRARIRVESAMFKRLSLPTVTEHFPKSRPAVTSGGQTPHEHTSDLSLRERARDDLWQRRSRCDSPARSPPVRPENFCHVIRASVGPARKYFTPSALHATQGTVTSTRRRFTDGTGAPVADNTNIMNFVISDHRPSRRKPLLAAECPPFDRIALILSGGGALGSYQAGVYQALAERNLHPDWVAGISIGAVNAALIAGNVPERCVDRLREFWETVSGPRPGCVISQA